MFIIILPKTIDFWFQLWYNVVTTKERGKRKMYRLDRMRKDYERFTKADAYIMGYNKDGLVYGVKWDKIPRKYTKVQKECSKAGGGYGLYVNINTKKARAELEKNLFMYAQRKNSKTKHTIKG